MLSANGSAVEPRNDIPSILLDLDRIFGTDRDKAVGRHITDFFPSSRLPAVLQKGRAELGERCSLKTEAPLLANRMPLQSFTRN